MKAASLLSLCLLGGISAPSHATFVVYNNQASFLAAVTAPGVDTYSGLSLSLLSSPLVRTAGSYSYTASASGNLFPSGTPADPALSTNVGTDTLTLNTFSPTVKAIGGFFFDTDINGAFAAGNIRITASDASGNNTQTITGATPPSFLGFVSTGSISSLSIQSVQPASGFIWPSVDNLTLATTSPVPVPSAVWLLGSGLIGLIASRKKSNV